MARGGIGLAFAEASGIQRGDFVIELPGEGEECAIGTMPARCRDARDPPAQLSRLPEMRRI